MILDIADSGMTHRQRYFARARWPEVVEMLVRDVSNPRGLAFQLSALRTHLEALQSEFLSQCFERVCDTYLSKLLWTESIATVHGISHMALCWTFSLRNANFSQKTLMLKKLLSFPNPWLMDESYSLMPLKHCQSILSTVQPHQYEQGLHRRAYTSLAV